MWVIFFQDTPHFWLIGGETYRVGKKDCHVIIQDDRSISRVHLTLRVGLHPYAEDEGKSAHHSSLPSSPSSATPQPITLIDSSTYGTTVTAAGEADEDTETQDSSTAHRGTSTTPTAALETGIVGLRFAPAAVNAAASTTAAAPPSLRLTKEVPCDVPVHRAAWRQFNVQLGHHGATLRLVWVDVSVLCEDVDVEAQMKLESALRCCGVRQEVGPVPPNAGGAAVGCSSTARSPRQSTVAGLAASPQSHPPPPQQLSRNTLSARDASDLENEAIGANPLPAVLGGSGVLSLSQRTALSVTPSNVRPASAAAVAAAASEVNPAVVSEADAEAFIKAVRNCYNHVDFLVTSIVQPSTAVVGMLCRAVPIVAPAFFVAIRDRVSPQLPLPDPRRFVPSVCGWWGDLIQHARLATPDSPPAPNLCSEGQTADTSATASPASSSSVVPAGPAAAGGAAALTPAQLSAYFAPNPQRCRLFASVVFVVVQRVLFEEVATYLDSTGASVVWEGSVQEWFLPCTESSDKLSFAPEGFQALQAFFTRHQRHVLLYNETEAAPFPACLPVLQHALGLCSVEYGRLVECIVMAQLPPELSAASGGGAFPDSARCPQTVAEVRARVRLACGGPPSSSSAHDSDTQDSEWEGAAATPGDAQHNPRDRRTEEEGQEEEKSTEGRRTDAHPLFPDHLADHNGGHQRKELRGSGEGGEGRESGAHPPHKRPRREDADGWVTLGKAPVTATSAELAPNAEGKATGSPGAPGVVGPERTVDIHCSPYVLPPYPCFADAPHGSAAAATASGGFVKQSLPPAEPLVELEEHRARRQLAASMLVARVPTVDADTVVPEQVVMGSAAHTSTLTTPGAAAAAAAFNTFDTVVHHASSRRRGTAARRGRVNASHNSHNGGSGRTGVNADAQSTRAVRSVAATARTARDAAAAEEVEVEDVEISEEGLRDSTASNTFHIFDIDGIF